MKQNSLSADPLDVLTNWKLFLAGDMPAFGKLMSQHFQILFHYGNKFSRDPEFVKDCIQDVFLNLWERRAYLASDVAVKPYLMASLRRHMHRTSKNFNLETAAYEQDAEFDILFSVEQEFIENEATMMMAQRVKHFVDLLPARQKEVVYLRFFQDLDRSQIAHIMDVSPQTVSNLLQIALKQLRKSWHLVSALLGFFFWA
ncbi:sigma-70 family RNA polymerase sigma factor [Dyadobacter flavalbus]|uniref:Sigma-70 family RNA polymerase sigma factor n=1 Tax=Dyadobacter flavalbus TaxID=2579942 RepID=A0A5M8QQF5_9BACT|nr:sigma-70 family RNA polymerase sigma factor [Dyadobacter flavalbus]KAA6438477.1 sigma-70 family RNA polymerase sigma factor [Dyadobacter flavalbus]